MSRWIGAMLLAVIISFQAVGPVAAQADAVWSARPAAQSALQPRQVRGGRNGRGAHDHNHRTSARIQRSCDGGRTQQPRHGVPALDSYEEAFKAYDRALAIHEPTLGPEQRYLAIVWSCCPKTRCRLGDAIGACGRKDN
jgi:hypothetical protein